MLDKLKSIAKFAKPVLFITLIIVGVLSLGALIYTYIPSEKTPYQGFRVAIDISWYPVELYDKERYMTLFSEELLTSIAKDQHFILRIVEVESSDLLPGIDSGNYEGILSSLVLTEEDAEKYLSSDPYFLLGSVLVTSRASKIKSLKDLPGKIIGVIRNSDSIMALRKYGSIEFQIYDYYNRHKLNEDVINHVVDGMVLDLMTAYEYTDKMYRGELKIVSMPLNNEGLRLIVKNDPQGKKRIQEFNDGLRDIKKRGIYAQLLLKWGLFDPANYKKL